jgi:hypothetical protein
MVHTEMTTHDHGPHHHARPDHRRNDSALRLGRVMLLAATVFLILTAALVIALH